MSNTKSQYNHTRAASKNRRAIKKRIPISKSAPRPKPQAKSPVIRGAQGPNAACHSFQGGVTETGNEIMGNPKVFVVYWDAFFVQNPDAWQRMNQFVTNLITGPYMSGLSQYQISSGTFIGSVVVDSTIDIPPNIITDGHLQWHIDQWINNGVVPYSGDFNQLILVFLPNNTPVNYQGLTQGPNGVGGWHSAYTHGTIFGWGKNNVFYAAIPSPFTLTNPITSIEFAGILSAPASHEMIESFTDRNQNGWLASSNGCEIADLCEAPPNNPNGSVTFNGWAAARYWFNNLNACGPTTGVLCNFVAIYDSNVVGGNGIPTAI